MKDIEEIRAFLEKEIVPRYDDFDAGHRRDHVHAVMATTQQLAAFYPNVNRAMLLVSAAYHDVGMAKGRKLHHIESARILRADKRLLKWFTPCEISMMADAVEDHRASSDHEPRTLYGRIVAESDRQIDPEIVIRRAMQYTRSHFPTMGDDAQFRRLKEHLQEKYAEGGYLKLWIPESDNAERLAALRAMMSDEKRLYALFLKILPTL